MLLADSCRWYIAQCMFSACAVVGQSDLRIDSAPPFVPSPLGERVGLRVERIIFTPPTKHLPSTGKEKWQAWVDTMER